MSDLAHNGLVYLALAFVPMFVFGLALPHWVSRAQPTRQQIQRVWLGYAVTTVAWVALVFLVLMPLGFGRSLFWGP